MPLQLKIIPLYAALLALLFIALSVRTLRLRRHLKIAVGDAGNTQMLRAMRAHANFAEYVPMCLLLLRWSSCTVAEMPGCCMVLDWPCWWGVSHTPGASARNMKTTAFGSMAWS